MVQSLLTKASRVIPVLASFIFPKVAYAQVKISSLSDIESKAKEGADAIVNIAKYTIGGVLAIGLVFMIYAIANNHPHAKEFGIGWALSVIIYLIAVMII